MVRGLAEARAGGKARARSMQMHGGRWPASESARVICCAPALHEHRAAAQPREVSVSAMPMCLSRRPGARRAARGTYSGFTSSRRRLAHLWAAAVPRGRFCATTSLVYSSVDSPLRSDLVGVARLSFVSDVDLIYKI